MSGRWPSQPVNIHDVLEHVKTDRRQAGFANPYRDTAKTYDPSLPAIPGSTGTKLIQAFLNLIKNAAEAIGRRPQRRHRSHCATAFRPGVRLSVPGSAGTDHPCL